MVESCRAPPEVVRAERPSKVYRKTEVGVDRMTIDGIVTLQFLQRFPMRWIITSSILLRTLMGIAG
jgi:hypothetical protein